jgi:DNA-binding NarL/FixJ family response regulator
MERSVLYVDPDPSDRQRFEEVAGEVEGLDVTLEESVESALDLLDDHAFDIVVSEAFTGEKDVDDLFSAARLSDRPVPCIIFSEVGMDELLKEDLLKNASAFTSKGRENAFKRLVTEITESLRPRSEIDYPVPDDEQGRLAAADRIDLDDLRQRDAFNRLTKLAQGLFDVRYAFVGVVKEETEQFISFEGDDVEELARECSICTFGILSDDATVVDNRMKDERFRYIDELQDLDIVFYAGYPLKAEDGSRIGMFCIMDDEPREFSAEDRENLKLFADEATELIRLYEGGE